MPSRSACGNVILLRLNHIQISWSISIWKILLFFGNYFCFSQACEGWLYFLLSSLALLPPATTANVWLLPVISLLFNTVSPVRACISLWLGRGGCQTPWCHSVQHMNTELCKGILSWDEFYRVLLKINNYSYDLWLFTQFSAALCKENLTWRVCFLLWKIPNYYENHFRNPC
jgi:hypothetical protein